MADLTHVLHAKAIDLGRLAIRATTTAGSGHPTTALSLAHLVTVLMYRVMRWTPADPDNPGTDRLVLSEGHAVPIIYAACTDLSVAFGPDGKCRAMTERDLMTLREIGSPIDGPARHLGVTDIGAQDFASLKIEPPAAVPAARTVPLAPLGFGAALAKHPA